MIIKPIFRRFVVLFAISVMTAAIVPVASGTSSIAQAACSPAGVDGGTVTVGYALPQADNYLIWARVQTPSADPAMFYLQIDDGCPVLLGGQSATPNTWTWVPYAAQAGGVKTAVRLTAGSHTFVMTGSSPELLLDRIIFATNSACVPSGTGDNCAVEDPVDSPSVTAQPTNTSVPVTPTPRASPAPSPVITFTARPQIVGDINGDGLVGIQDLSALLSKWGTASPEADLNRDGRVGILDLSLLLAHWK